jgi:serine/threonine protein kinase
MENLSTTTDTKVMTSNTTKLMTSDTGFMTSLPEIMTSVPEITTSDPEITTSDPENHESHDWVVQDSDVTGGTDSYPSLVGDYTSMWSQDNNKEDASVHRRPNLALTPTEINAYEAMIKHQVKAHPYKINDVIGDYKLVKFLGAGGFGHTFIAENLKDSQQYVLKAIFLYKPMFVWSAEQEANVLEHIKTYFPKCEPDIACFKERFTLYEGKLNMNVMFIISSIFWDSKTTERKPATSLNSFLRKNNDYTLLDALNIYQKIVSAVAKLHHIGVVHLDLKPENLLIDSTSMNIHVIDFGVSCLNTEADKKNCQVVGTRGYQDPQMKQQYDTKYDIYSLAVVLQDCVRKFVESSPDFINQSESYRDYLNNRNMEYAYNALNMIYSMNITAYIRNTNAKQMGFEPHNILTKIIIVSKFMMQTRPNTGDISNILQEVITALNNELQRNTKYSRLQKLLNKIKSKMSKT